MNIKNKLLCISLILPLSLSLTGCNQKPANEDIISQNISETELISSTTTTKATTSETLETIIEVVCTDFTTSEEEITDIHQLTEEELYNYLMGIIQSKDIDKLLRYNNNPYNPIDESQFDYLKTVDIESYSLEIKTDNSKFYPRNYAEVTMNITASESDKFPIGTSKWVLYYAQDDANGVYNKMFLVPLSEYEKNISKNLTYNQQKLLENCIILSYASGYSSLDTYKIENFQFSPLQIHMLFDTNYITDYIPETNEYIYDNAMTVDKFNQFLKDFYGSKQVVSESDFLDSEINMTIIENGILNDSGHCSLWTPPAKIIKNYESTETGLIAEIWYYSDPGCWNVAKKITYTFENANDTKRLVDVNCHFDNGLDVAVTHSFY